MSNFKQFFVTISMLTKEQLKKIEYSWDERPEIEKMFSCFPSIPMIKNNLSQKDEFEIIAIKTKDDGGRSEHNFDVFKSELNELSKELGMEIKVSKVIELPHEETNKKHIQFFNELCKSYKPESELYVDVTYGSKISSITQFATLVYAEKNRDCAISEVIYGKFAHIEGNNIGTIYDMTSLYELNMMINNCSVLPGVNIDKILNMYAEE